MTKVLRNLFLISKFLPKIIIIKLTIKLSSKDNKNNDLGFINNKNIAIIDNISRDVKFHFLYLNILLKTIIKAALKTVSSKLVITK